MVNSKKKGTDFERDIIKKLNTKVKKGKFKRVAGSGAFGTIMSIPDLFGDITGEVEGFPKKFRGEAKVGYGGAKSLTMKKEWLDKIVMEANSTYSIPFLIARFSNSRSGVEEFAVLDFDTFVYLLNLVTSLAKEFDTNE